MNTVTVIRILLAIVALMVVGNLVYTNYYSTVFQDYKRRFTVATNYRLNLFSTSTEGNQSLQNTSSSENQKQPNILQQVLNKALATANQQVHDHRRHNISSIKDLTKSLLNPFNKSKEKLNEAREKADYKVNRHTNDTINKESHEETDSYALKTAEPQMSSASVTTRINSQHETSVVVDTLKTIKEQLNEALAKATEQYNILVWDRPWGHETGPYEDANHMKIGNNCGNCAITYNQAAADDHRTKAVVYHVEELWKRGGLPHINRNLNQMYVFWSMEGPRALRCLRKMTFEGYDDVFNLTMTYRRDSDIMIPYSTAVEVLNDKYVREDEFDAYMGDLIATKTGLSAWLVTDCNYVRDARIRKTYAQLLVNAGLRVERRGHCFNNPVPPGQERKLIAAHKFYLAFENHVHCKDYITEKMFTNAFRNDAVPIVWGATEQDYKDVAPPGSFIFAEKYSVDELVAYINYLDQNDTAYAEYFRWRTMKAEDMPMFGREHGFCQLCRVLHGINVDNIYNPLHNDSQYADIPLFKHPNRTRIVPSVRDWFFKTENSDCLADHEI